MFTEFGSIADLLTIGQGFFDAVYGYIMPALGIAAALGILGLVLRGKGGRIGSEGSAGDRPLVSTGAPVSRPSRPR